MARHPDLPRRIPPLLLSKRDIFDRLKKIDSDRAAQRRILAMDTKFRERVRDHIRSLPSANTDFAKWRTNPFVLVFHSMQRSYSAVAQIEGDLAAAKAFSSMETAAGKMIEDVVLPVYGWEQIPSPMHSDQSVLDARKTGTGNGQPPTGPRDVALLGARKVEPESRHPGRFVCATIKSGPWTLNDDMARNIANDLVRNASAWAQTYNANEVDFTYGALYGTRKQSNKKDWHILRNIDEGRPPHTKRTASHKGAWAIAYKDGPLSVSAAVRVGIEWWDFLGGPDTWIELCCALIRSCITPASGHPPAQSHSITDMHQILDMSGIEDGYNVSLLQSSQLEWLLLLARHFSDGLTE